MVLLYALLQYLLTALIWIIIGKVVLSWLIHFQVVNLHNEFVRAMSIALHKLTEPLFRPVRRILPDLGPIDIAPMVVLFIVGFLQQQVLPYLFTTLAISA